MPTPSTRAQSWSSGDLLRMTNRTESSGPTRSTSSPRTRWVATICRCDTMTHIILFQEGLHQYYSQPLRFNTGNPDVTSYNVTGLQPDTKYKIQVKEYSYYRHIAFIKYHCSYPCLPSGCCFDKERWRYPIPACDSQDPWRCSLPTGCGSQVSLSW